MSLDIRSLMPHDMLFGMRVHVSELCMSKRWQFPKHRFIEYEQSDEWWCRKYGFGKEVEEPGCYQVGDDLYMHPIVWERFKQEMQLRQERTERCFSIPVASKLKSYFR